MVRNKVPTIIFVSKEDKYSFESSEKIHARMECEKKIKTYPSSMHGTDMFRGTDMEVNILRWIR